MKSPLTNVKMSAALAVTALAAGVAAVTIGSNPPAFEIATQVSEPAIPDAARTGPWQVEQVAFTEADMPRTGGATLYRPVGVDDSSRGGVVVMPGWSGAPDEVGWVADHLASHGFFVLLAEPPERLDGTWRRAEAMQGALAYLRDTPETQERLDTDRLGVWGFSMGGGGTLRVAESRDDLKAVVAAHPWDSVKSFPGIGVPTLILSGADDRVAPPSDHAEQFYNSVSRGDVVSWIDFADVGHQFPKQYDPRSASLVTAWFKVFIDEDTRYRNIVCSIDADRDGYTRVENAWCDSDN